MHAYNDRVRQLIDSVRRAFWDVPYPGDDRLLEEDSSAIYEVEKLQSQDWNSHWANVPDSVIEWHANRLAFLSPEAYRFYLPAFISYSLEKPESSEPVLPFLVYNLMETAERKRDCYQRRIALFTPEQKSVVLDFLNFVRDDLKDAMCLREASIAIEWYWGRAGGGHKSEENGTESRTNPIE